MEKRVELIWAQQTQMDNGQLMQKHYHACYQMYYILSGTATFIIDGEILKINTDDCFIIPEMSEHQMLPLAKDGMKCYEMKLYIKDEFLKAHLNGIQKPVNDNKTIKKMLSYIIENWTCHSEQNIIDTEYILSTIILNFFIENLSYENKDSTHILTDNYSDVTRSVLIYIEKFFSSKFRLETLANHLNYNKNYLCYIFKKDTKVSIIDYLNFIRIRRAIIFFAFYSQDVYTTCESVGFSNLSHFSRTFKSLVGIAPRDFKRAFSRAGQQETANYFAREMMLNYNLCTMEEAMNSLENIGTKAKILLNQADADK